MQARRDAHDRVGRLLDHRVRDVLDADVTGPVHHSWLSWRAVDAPTTGETSGSLVLGSATGNPMWALFGLALIVGYGLARWFTTSYRIGADEVQLGRVCFSARYFRCRATGSVRCPPTRGYCIGCSG